MANATLDELLKRNRAPNEAEIHVIHEERRKVEEEIVRLAGMLLGMDSSAAQTVNNELNARRKIHLELLESLRSVESVVRTCPADVWLEVFKQLCVAAGHDWTRQILRVTAVCRGWRGVAVGAPSLWKVLNIAGNGWADEEDMETLNDMLTRSRGSALHVTVGPEPSTPTATWANQHKSSLCDAGRRRSVLDKLLAHANRIEAMAVKLHPFAIYYVALPASVTLPRLRSASIRTVGADREDDIGDMLAWLEQACSLERLAIGVPFKIPRLTSSAIGWAKLAALDLSVPMELSDAMTILARCTALQECRLHRVTEERSAAHLPTRLTLPKLCLLDFGLQTGCCAAFFDLVVCPALTDLTAQSCVLQHIVRRLQLIQQTKAAVPAPLADSLRQLDSSVAVVRTTADVLPTAFATTAPNRDSAGETSGNKAPPDARIAKKAKIMPTHASVFQSGAVATVFPAEEGLLDDLVTFDDLMTAGFPPDFSPSLPPMPPPEAPAPPAADCPEIIVRQALSLYNTMYPIAVPQTSSYYRTCLGDIATKLI
ncbi:hypothetical protein C8R43DRAFT_1118431 [Mycena crocata]|nr:hypothetical protein C8R43DRAFT_1118431 [Mycena crocata]